MAQFAFQASRGSHADQVGDLRQEPRHILGLNEHPRLRLRWLRILRLGVLVGGYNGRRRLVIHHPGMRQDLQTATVRLRVVNHANIVTFYHSRDGGAWVKHSWQMEVSGFHHNVLGGFLSLKFGVYCAGVGTVKLRNFVYMASSTS